MTNAKNDRIGDSHSKHDLRLIVMRMSSDNIYGIFIHFLHVVALINMYSLNPRADIDEEHDNLLDACDVSQEKLTLEFRLKICEFLLFWLEHTKSSSQDIPLDRHFKLNLWCNSFCSGRQVFIFQRVPALFTASYPPQRDHDTSQKLNFVITILVVNCHIEHRRHVFHITGGEKKVWKFNLLNFLTRTIFVFLSCWQTYNVNILFQFGVNVLYSVCVCRRALTSSRTQKGSDLPPMSADARPVAPYTFTVKWPTSRRFW